MTSLMTHYDESLMFIDIKNLLMDEELHMQKSILANPFHANLVASYDLKGVDLKQRITCTASRQ